jgi:hypothetical protein
VQAHVLNGSHEDILAAAMTDLIEHQEQGGMQKTIES